MALDPGTPREIRAQLAATLRTGLGRFTFPAVRPPDGAAQSGRQPHGQRRRRGQRRSSKARSQRIGGQRRLLLHAQPVPALLRRSLRPPVRLLRDVAARPAHARGRRTATRHACASWRGSRSPTRARAGAYVGFAPAGGRRRGGPRRNLLRERRRARAGTSTPSLAAAVCPPCARGRDGGGTACSGGSRSAGGTQRRTSAPSTRCSTGSSPPPPRSATATGATWGWISASTRRAATPSTPTSPDGTSTAARCRCSGWSHRGWRLTSCVRCWRTSARAAGCPSGRSPTARRWS